MQRAAMANGARCEGRCSALRFWGQMGARNVPVPFVADVRSVLGGENSISKSLSPLLSAKSTTFAESIMAEALVQTDSSGKDAIRMAVPDQHITTKRL